MVEQSSADSGVERDRQLILSSKEKGRGATIWAYTRLSGPGWLQSAITLGGGSLTGSLYLGVLAGFSLLWLQPLAMILGVIMLSAISYVTLSTGERPFQAINKHVNPVMGWGWALATMMANLVWSLPQFSLGTAALQQNLLPGVFGADGLFKGVGTHVACGGILLVSVVVVLLYDSGKKGIALFEIILKIMVGVIMVSFFGVVIKMTLIPGGLHWGEILKGLFPDIRLLWSPAASLKDSLDSIDPRYRDFWIKVIVADQRDVMITAAATAVGINMTFLLPYSMLKRGWDKDFRGLAVFDLGTGLFVPFILATGCVVIASAARFHANPAPGLAEPVHISGEGAQASPKLVGAYRTLALKRLEIENPSIQSEIRAIQDEAQKTQRIEEHVGTLPLAERRMAAMLVSRDAFDLAKSLEPLTGTIFSQYIFGIGVAGMAISSIIILMLINGFVICEMFGFESGGWPHRIGCLMPAVGAAGPFFWKQAAPRLAIPTSVFGMVLIPIAYCTFFMLINQKHLMKDNMPQGKKRIVWNILMSISVSLAAFGSVWSIWSKARINGLLALGCFILLAVFWHFVFPRERNVQGSNQT